MALIRFSFSSASVLLFSPFAGHLRGRLGCLLCDFRALSRAELLRPRVAAPRPISDRYLETWSSFVRAKCKPELAGRTSRERKACRRPHVPEGATCESGAGRQPTRTARGKRKVIRDAYAASSFANLACASLRPLVSEDVPATVVLFPCISHRDTQTLADHTQLHVRTWYRL